MRRKYPDSPIVAVAALIINDEGEILLIKRGAEPGKGLWSIPGGAVELGENLHDALVREVKEETGLDIEPLSFLDVYEVLDYDDEGRLKYHYVIIDYLARLKRGVLKPSTDALDARWVSLEEVYSYKLTKSLRSLLEKHREKIIEFINDIKQG
ncbi:NUDIX hydrolase [Candidatus Geothermarchaeota archaeon]|nr:MAG: NUDIX hydrolase [Candidatus Geothermarchaeota archaeon]